MNENTIADQLDILEETKSQIKQAIIDKGQSVSSSDSFRSYATKIGNIEVLNAQSEIVTPTTSQQLIEPDQYHNALSSVTVNAVTSAIDQNIVASNIKNGVTILGVQGTYNPYQIREYASETAMNNDIANIQEGEVVKVISSGVTTFYVKETTMKKLVKEEDTLSPAQAQQAEEQVGDLLGEEE